MSIVLGDLEIVKAVYNPDPQATDRLCLGPILESWSISFDVEVSCPEPAPGHLDGCVNFGTFHLCDATCPLLRAGHPKCFSGMGG